MIPRALPLAALVVLLGAASVAPSAFGATTVPSVDVRPGLNGTARPGRWLPVDLTITTDVAGFTGAVIVEWGGAISRRDLSRVGAGTERVSLLVRTIAASPDVRVQLITDRGETIVDTRSAVTVLPADDTVVLCIGDAADGERCSLRIAAADAPSDWRGYDLADAVRWPDAHSRGPTPAARAFATWEAARWWLDSGSVDPVVAPFDNDSRLADRTNINLGLYVLTLLALTAVASWRRTRALLLLGAPLVTAVAGVGVIERRAQDVDIQASSFIHQFAGNTTAIVMARGEVEHPGAEPLELVPEIDNAVVELVRAPQRTDASARGDGRAVYRHTAGRSVRQRFELNATSDGPWLNVVAEAGGLSITNRSSVTLTDCQIRVTEAANLQTIATLSPGSHTFVATVAPLAAGDTVTCRLSANWLTWTLRGGRATTRGSAFLIFHQWNPDAAR